MSRNKNTPQLSACLCVGKNKEPGNVFLEKLLKHLSRVGHILAGFSRGWRPEGRAAAPPSRQAARRMGLGQKE